MYKIIVYGGAFNPPHAGHVDVIKQLSNQGERILVVPSFRHAFAKEMAPYDLRLQWLKTICSDLAKQGIEAEADDCERAIGVSTNGPIYSLDMLKHVAEREGVEEGEIGFVIGEDNLQHIGRYHKANELLETFALVVAKEQIHLHSTDIRNALGQGIAIEPSWLASGLSTADYSYFSYPGAHA
ncbi:adenylyltransferase/cytidyltransferase family protein (plasmid) [Pseudomonas sp. FeN3W]|nr:adenylyltransferase/cytidyltransferase family protein [Pseudomonas sp. FeN3W]